MIFLYFKIKFKKTTYQGWFQSKIFDKIVLLKKILNIIYLESLNVHESEWYKSPVAKMQGWQLVVRVQELPFQV